MTLLFKMVPSELSYDICRSPFAVYVWYVCVCVWICIWIHLFFCIAFCYFVVVVFCFFSSATRRELNTNFRMLPLNVVYMFINPLALDRIGWNVCVFCSWFSFFFVAIYCYSNQMTIP